MTSTTPISMTMTKGQEEGRYSHGYTGGATDFM